MVPIRNEADILELIKQENSWEQILYDVVAIESLDPWNLDLNLLSTSFGKYIASMKVLDFRIPAKWVIIASMLLRMKSDGIKILKMDEEPEADDILAGDGLDGIGEAVDAATQRLDIDPLEALPIRKPVRRITITELVGSLRKVLNSQVRREGRIEERRSRIKLTEEDITRRIENLYRRITSMMGRMKDKEVSFTDLVGNWQRDHVVDTFLPLMHLDQEKKVTCRQERIFDEIFIRSRQKAT